MHIPSSRVVTCFLLFLLWNQLKEIAYLGERTTMQMPHAARFCSRWSSKERCLLPTSTFREGIAYSADLIRLLFAPTMLYRILVTDYRQREERQLCQT